jgi:hypothetical protein
MRADAPITDGSAVSKGDPMTFLAFLAARLKEPSSYAGLGAVLGAAGVHADDAVLQAVIQVLISLAGLVAVLMPENSLSGERSPRFSLDPKGRP